MTKEAARHYVKGLKEQMTPQAVFSRSRKVTRWVFESELFHRAHNILTYVSYNQEVDTHVLIHRSLACGKNVYVPKVCGSQMCFHQIKNFDSLAPGRFGILEPTSAFLPEWDTVSGLMIMPGLAFDYEYNRVGYGGGFYDRYLSTHGGMVTAALCFDFQLIDRIEPDLCDIKPDYIICEQGFLQHS